MSLSLSTVFQVMLIDKDVRRMSAKPKPDGTPPDLARPADILIYEARLGAPSASRAGGNATSVADVC